VSDNVINNQTLYELNGSKANSRYSTQIGCHFICWRTIRIVLWCSM